MNNIKQFLLHHTEITMGRVAKYKKVKKFDKDHQAGEYVWGSKASTKLKTRSVTAEKHRSKKMKRTEGVRDDGGFDLPPDKDDFDIDDLNFVVKKEKKRSADDGLVTPTHQTVIPSAPVVADANANAMPAAVVKNNTVKLGNRTVQLNIPINEREEIKAAKMLQIDPKTGKSKSKNDKIINIEGKQQGESMTAFNRRLKEETKNALAENFKKRKAPDEDDEERLAKIQRKKEYAKLRKMKRKGKVPVSQSADNNYDSDDELVTGEQAVSFLERAERPPTFKQLPRGAHKILKMEMKGVKGDSGGKMDEGKIKAEQNSMEIMRRKVQAQYAIMKEKRMQARRVLL